MGTGQASQNAIILILTVWEHQVIQKLEILHTQALYFAYGLAQAVFCSVSFLNRKTIFQNDIWTSKGSLTMLVFLMVLETCGRISEKQNHSNWEFRALSLLESLTFRSLCIQWKVTWWDRLEVMDFYFKKKTGDSISNEDYEQLGKL